MKSPLKILDTSNIRILKLFIVFFITIYFIKTNFYCTLKNMLLNTNVIR